jgi:hypothetical protein
MLAIRRSPGSIAFISFDGFGMGWSPLSGTVDLPVMLYPPVMLYLPVILNMYRSP